MLLGYGLVVGLNGSGDKSKFTMQSLQNLLRNAYVKIPAGAVKSKNIATVMVTASLPPFSRQGDKINIKVASIGDAISIDQGLLILTQLKGVDGKVYILAQGKIQSDTNNPNTGIIYRGGIVEGEVDFELSSETSFSLSLNKNSASMATSIEEAINKHFNAKIARAYDTKTISVKKLPDFTMIKFMSIIEDIPIDSNEKLKIIVNLNKQIILTGEDIEIKPFNIVQPNYSLTIKSQVDSIKGGYSLGKNINIRTDDEKINLDDTLVSTTKIPTVAQLVRAMKVMKLGMGDILTTLRMLSEGGAIDAKIEVVE
jgi:flagellar P-ring protein precursor FlgI